MRKPTADDVRNPRKAVETLRRSWRAETDSARGYRDLAAAEKDERRRGILVRMAEAEDRHAERWARKLAELGEPVPTVRETARTRWNRLVARLVGAEVTLRKMEAEEDRQTARYGAEHRALADQDAEAASILKEFAREEEAHARAIRSMVPALGPQTALDVMFRRERHTRAGTWISDAVYGVNDGLGSVFGIVSGVAGATENTGHYIIIAGMAGMIASALSMGSSAYLAVKSEREVHEAEIGRERAELEENPEEEIEEMALFYQLQGFDEEQAKRMSRQLAEDPERMLKTLAQTELGLSDERLPSPWISATSATLSTAVGAFIPVIPFFFMKGISAVVTAAVVSIVAHFVVGAAKSLITTRSWWSSGLEMTFVGILAGSVTYGLGLLFGRL
ncbi:MAG TPA: VIT1/CCC1 transporter family protein [Armatimonadota bacterium]|jgi:VIT1/CCC1 family predicted Fe2+/Mn2+ transporter/rubrerythrin